MATLEQGLAWVSEFTELLSLQEWDVEVEAVEAGELPNGAWAEVDIHRDIHRGVVRFAAQREDDAIRSSLLHEVVHLATSDLEIMVRYAIKHLSPQAGELLRTMSNDAEEQLVRRLVRAIERSSSLADGLVERDLKVTCELQNLSEHVGVRGGEYRIDGIRRCWDELVAENQRLRSGNDGR